MKRKEHKKTKNNQNSSNKKDKNQNKNQNTEEYFEQIPNPRNQEDRDETPYFTPDEGVNSNELDSNMGLTEDWGDEE